MKFRSSVTVPVLIAASMVLAACNPSAPPLIEFGEEPQFDPALVAEAQEGDLELEDVGTVNRDDEGPTGASQADGSEAEDAEVEEDDVESTHFAPAFPGDVEPGHVRFGASVGGNSDPYQRHEVHAGTSVGLRRTYWRWDQRTTSMIRTATADLAAGRLPWVSVKTPGWAEMASGAHDDEIDSMIRALNELDGPVWLTVHHEPEGGNGTPYPDDPAGADGWRAMQIRVRQRIDAIGTENIAFAPILMSWTFDPASKRDPMEWWVDGIWDFAGVDHYLDKEKHTSFERKRWLNVRDFYTRKGLKIAVGEWGNKGSDDQAAAENEAFYQLAVDSGSSRSTQVIGLAAFDSNLNSTRGGWELMGSQLTMFWDLMSRSTSILAHETGAR